MELALALEKLTNEKLLSLHQVIKISFDHLMYTKSFEVEISWRWLEVPLCHGSHFLTELWLFPGLPSRKCSSLPKGHASMQIICIPT